MGHITYGVHGGTEGASMAYCLAYLLANSVMDGAEQLERVAGLLKLRA